MRFLIDNCSGPGVAGYLRQAGHDVAAAWDLLPGADDADILAHAFREGRILVTDDKDFGELVYRHRRPHCGVVLLRPFPATPARRIHLLQRVLERYGTRLADHFTVADEDHIRSRAVATSP